MDNTFHTYHVTLVFDYSIITTTVVALDPDDATKLAINLLHGEFLIPKQILMDADEITVKLLKEESNV